MTSSGWGTPTPGHTNPAAFQNFASSVTQAAFNRPQKRKNEHEDEPERMRSSSPKDESMEGSPTPERERPKRAVPKRARVANLSSPSSSKGGGTSKEDKNSDNTEADDIDIGVLLANLPTQSLLPILTSLLQNQPSLKSTILPLIPRPTLEIAVHALSQAAKRLREAYPYSNGPIFSQALPTFGPGRTAHSVFQPPPPTAQPVMRDNYVISRLRPHISEYVSTCISFFPYFSCIPSVSQLSTSPSQRNTTSNSQALPNDKFYPYETFLFLSAVTNQILDQPPTTVSELAPLIVPKLSEEWKAWVSGIDTTVNQQGRMFSSEIVKSWERGLDEMAESKDAGIRQLMRGIKDSWVLKVGWLVKRMPQQAMDEL
ncbi:hypothetical protein CPB84DRAFT_1676589 [Gymnopilus junonius]|uniref:Tethering factor for nuclear proteasome STS1 n=1 Tax=Gymnopilus junonius TaxID=109634 RepID=A0A9P5NUA5_GYMJU|nr:hypothetical protein CPB84DRAFT_1676589 [Gymnopilus junonius]